MTTTTKGTTMTTPESPAVPVFAPHGPATGAQAPSEPGNGTGSRTDLEWLVDTLNSTVAELVAMKARRCDGCGHASRIFAGTVDCSRFGSWYAADHACNAWQPKAGQ